MYPGSIFELIDQSQIATIPESTTVNNAPVFMQAFGSDKGPEGYRLVQGDVGCGKSILAFLSSNLRRSSSSLF